MNWSDTEPDSWGYHPGRVLGHFPINIWKKEQEGDGKKESLTEKFMSHYSLPFLHETNYLPELPIKRKTFRGQGELLFQNEQSNYQNLSTGKLQWMTNCCLLLITSLKR